MKSERKALSSGSSCRDCLRERLAEDIQVEFSNSLDGGEQVRGILTRTPGQ